MVRPGDPHAAHRSPSRSTSSAATALRTGAQAVRLLRKEAVARDTLAFHFERPHEFHFVAGQAINLVLPPASGDGQAAMRHAFSLVSAPHESELVIATRMRETPFKRALAALPVGRSVSLEGPFGGLTLRDPEARQTVFIAGGIGIAPFVSMLRQAQLERPASPVTLIYASRRPEDAAFLDELQALQARCPDFRLFATMSDPSALQDGWQGLSGRVDERLLERLCGPLSSPVFYIVGSPAMVADVQNALGRIGIASADIHTEGFHGY
ncbi:FAD-dependent oxidoreductase [Aquabacterium sp. A7-Y]|uniref:ferredoxin--NADP reductase n=1 Tax=Aquabacterium sp. A7-Y TaxID=1349605 RepID=UPI00223D35C0|nr:FAD-dependent oxidoreductase [Aquabacterium sp. A7-Y]MCW7540462.1 FAD-dependent oxidoreductase [Aquabacterium sp. A7-Y]